MSSLYNILHELDDCLVAQITYQSVGYVVVEFTDGHEVTMDLEQIECPVNKLENAVADFHEWAESVHQPDDEYIVVQVRS